MEKPEVKSVSFNLSDPYEKKFFDHAMKFKGFSTYVKRLIHKDMEGWQTNDTSNKNIVRSESGGIKLDLR
ncbi:hypothetical protein [Alkalihalobacillus sp. 1P02AB]|uniref:hypothetical protein n=1 Tax=Alkalihalobacillus sp. 1P02AB TaxID=3132260 RepID=UPI0039A46EC2